MQGKKRRGSALLIVMIVMMVTFALGSAFLDLSTQAMLRGRNDFLRAQALNVAEAGVQKALYYLRGTAPDGTTDGSWRTTGLTETVSGQGSYTIVVQDGAGSNAGKLVIQATGTANIGSRTVSRLVRAVAHMNQEDISIWNNAIFGGVGQAAKSIQGNVVIRGSVHLLGDGEPFTDTNGNGVWDAAEPYTDLNHNGRWDPGEPYTDTNHNGRYDPAEPYVDVNGNGTYDPPLTTTDLADDISGSANIGNNYAGMPSSMLAKIPAIPTTNVGGTTLQTLHAKMRVKAGLVDISGSATIGASSNSSGTPAGKGKMDGMYVNDGYGGNKGSASVYSDNGTSAKYDLGNFVHFPTLSDPVTVNGVSYTSEQSYYNAVALQVNGNLTLTYGTAFSSISDGNGNSLSVDASGNITINGIVYVNGNIYFNHGSGNGGGSTFTYHGRGTVVASGNIEVHANILPNGIFPTGDAMGFVATKNLSLATGSGDSQMSLMGAFYAQDQVTSAKQNNICGTFVSSYYSMTNVPNLYQVPTLDKNLPPGMPGATPITLVQMGVDSWRDLAPGS